MAGDRGAFTFFVRLGQGKPGWVASMLALCIVLGLGLASQLEFQTSRFSLVDPDDDYQSRLLSFFDRFGYPDTPIALVRGGTADDRRIVVDAFTRELQSDPKFSDRILGKVGATEVAELLLLHRPDGIVQFRDSLPEGTPLVDRLEEGLPGLMKLLSSQLQAGLDGDIEADPAQTDDGLARIAVLATVLEAQLSGASRETAIDTLAKELGSGSGGLAGSGSQGLDEKGYLSGRNGDHLLVAIFPELAGTEIGDYAPLVESLRSHAAVATRDAPEDVELLLTGLPVLNVDEQEVLQTGMISSTVAVVVGIFLVLLAGFRSIRHTLVALIPVGIATAIGLGVMYLLYGHLNMLTSSFMAVLMGLGIDFSVHLLARRDEAVRRGKNRTEALVEAATSAGPGILTGAITTALAFTTLIISRFTAFAEMGVVTAISLLVTFAVVMLFIPLALGRGKADEKLEPPRAPTAFSWLPATARLAPIPILIVAVLASAAGGWGLSQVVYNYRYFDFLPEDHDSTRALELLEADGAMSPLFAHVTAPDVETARRLAAELREKSTVLEVQSASDMLPELDEVRLGQLRAAFDGLREPDWQKLQARKATPGELAPAVLEVVDVLDEVQFALDEGQKSTKGVTKAQVAFKSLHARLQAMPVDGPEVDELENEMADLLSRAWSTAARVSKRGDYVAQDLPPLFRNRFYSKAGDELAIYAYPSIDIWNLEEGRRFSDEMESVHPEAAGHGMSMFHHFGWILIDFQRAAMIAAGLVLVVLIVDFRRPVDVGLAIVPVVVGFCLMGLTFWLVGVELNPASIVVLPLILGIGIDAGVHMVHRTRQSADQNGGVARLEDLAEGTGAAVVLASVTTMVGFAGLMLSEYGAMSSLGITMVIGIAACIVASVLVLPALLLVTGQAR